MRIGLTGGASSVDKIVAQAQQAEADGFSALWYASAVAGDPLVAMALAGRATTSIELGTAVLQTYPCHPLLQANRVASVVNAMGRAGFTLGLGPSHEPLITGVFGLSYDHPGRNTEQYMRIISGLLRGEDVDFAGEDWTTHSLGRAVTLDHPVPLLLSALSPRMLRIAGEFADGVVLWMASAKAIEGRIAPGLRAAAESAGRTAPRIVAGLPVAVNDDLDEVRCRDDGDVHDVFGDEQLPADHRGRRRHPAGRRRHRRRRGLRAGAAAGPDRCGRHRRLGPTDRRGRRPRATNRVAGANTCATQRTHAGGLATGLSWQ